MSLSTSELAAHILSAAKPGTTLACDCLGHQVEIYSGTTVLDIETLIEHAAYDHPARRGIMQWTVETLIEDKELSTLLGLA